MKRDFSFSKNIWKYIIKWIISFLIAISLLLIFILLLTFAQKQFRFNDAILRIILMVGFTFSAGICAYLFRKFSDVKGYVCGLSTGILFSTIKLFMSLISCGVGKSNLWIYLSVISASIIGGILAANQNKKTKW